MDAALFGGLSASMQSIVKGLFTQTSGSFTPSLTGWYEVTCCGGGGGSAGAYTANPFNITRSGGGGAGEENTILHWLTAGAAYSFTIGAGGAAGASTATAASNSGGNGGNTTFTGPLITQIALGGSGSTMSTTTGPLDGTGAVGGRRDGITAAGSNRAVSGAWFTESWSGACGGTANGVAGGSAGPNVGVTSASRAGSGACSSIAAGGGGAAALGVGSAGTYGAGAGGSWASASPGHVGAVGGNGWIRIIQKSAS